MDGRLVEAVVKTLCRRRVPSLIERAAGIALPDFNPHNANFTHTVDDLTAYRAPDGHTTVVGTTDLGKQALMRELTEVAYAQHQQREKRAQARTTRALPGDAMLTLVNAYIDLLRLDQPDKPFPRNADDKAWTRANVLCRDNPDLHKALCEVTRAQRLLARDIALEACAEPLHAAKKIRAKSAR